MTHFKCLQGNAPGTILAIQYTVGTAVVIDVATMTTMHGSINHQLVIKPELILFLLSYISLMPFLFQFLSVGMILHLCMRGMLDNTQGSDEQEEESAFLVTFHFLYSIEMRSG
jgi:hypothetical protein